MQKRYIFLTEVESNSYQSSLITVTILETHLFTDPSIPSGEATRLHDESPNDLPQIRTREILSFSRSLGFRLLHRPTDKETFRSGPRMAIPTRPISHHSHPTRTRQDLPQSSGRRYQLCPRPLPLPRRVHRRASRRDSARH